MVVFEGVESEELANFLRKRKFSPLDIKTIHEQLRYSKGIKKKVLLILYNSGKLLLQGDADAIELTAEQLRGAGIGKEVKQIKFRKELGWVIGSDESLKGDTFGGLVVAAVKADDMVRKELIALGVADSKVLNDKEIIQMAEKVKRLVQCEIINLTPEEYNHKDNEGVTKLMNKLHKNVAKYLKPGTHVVDKYPGCSVGDIMETKAESKFVEVAAASVLARATALQQLNYLSKKAGFAIPKGSTHVKWALEELKEKGLNPREFVKLHFKNVEEFFG
ncbi:MAG: hypothetical protein ABIG93_01445 [archaeon]|nr:hypothetical protein [Nanoarchaeota archaeon]